jgi:hypothetical protein
LSGFAKTSACSTLFNRSIARSRHIWPRGRITDHPQYLEAGSPGATRVERRAKQAHNLELGCRKVRFPSSCGMHGAIC